ncbi:hypothetical protein BJV74DRAFT_41888 [Russula compacta]|nr:hypothetical protein BJV74DRAFT_41888 [Russula compacta]
MTSLMSSDPSSQPDRPPPIDKPSNLLRITQQERAVLSRAAEVHTVIHVTQIWADRLKLTSIYASFFTTIDSLLFKLVSRSNDETQTSKLATLTLSLLVGALIFHSAAAALAYVGSLVLIRHKLIEARAVLGNPSSKGTVIVADAKSMPSALQSGGVRFSENVDPSPIPATRIFSTTTPADAKSSLLSVVTEALLHHPAGLDIDIRRESFNLRAIMPCIGAPINDADDDQTDDSQKNGISLALLLNRCHCVCSCFMLVGFTLVVTGIVACLWGLLELYVAIFGSVCIAVCLILGFGALA